MMKLPRGWTLCEIGDVLHGVEMTRKNEENREIFYVDISSIDNKANRITNPKRINLSDAPSRARQKIRAGDVLFSTVRPYLRNIAAVDQEFDGEVASTGFAVIRGAKGINPRYLFYKCISHDFVNALTGEQYGVSYPAVKEEQVKARPLELPPTQEQRRIVERIQALFEEIDKGVESLRAAKNTNALYRQSLLKSAFEGRLTAEWRVQNPDKLEDPDALLARIREARTRRYRTALDEWERVVAAWRKDGEKGRRPAKPKRLEGFDLLCTSDHLPWPRVRVQVLLDAPLINGRSVKDRAGGFPVLRLTALKNGRMDFRESKEGDWSQNDAEPFFVQRDDIFIARGNGSKKLVGIASLALDDPMPIAFPDTMIRARLDTSAVQPEYFLLAWNSWTVRRQIEKAARTTAGIYKINQGHICGFVLPLPSLAEQAEIVRVLQGRLEAAEELDLEIDANLARADFLRQSILKQAFAGQLVPQDPDDEPAVALLERIQVERTKAPARRRRQRVGV